MALLPTTRFTTAFKPLTQITPTTFRDGYTFLDLYENLRKFLEDVLTPELDSKLAFIYEQTQAEVDRLTTEMNASVDAWEGLFNAFMADVTAELEALNDTAVAALVGDGSSKLRVALNSIFAKQVDMSTMREDFDTFVNESNSSFATKIEARDSIVKSLAPSASVVARTSKAWGVYEVLRIFTHGQTIPGLIEKKYPNDYEKQGTSGNGFRPGAYPELLTSVHARTGAGVIINADGWNSSSASPNYNVTDAVQIKDGIIYHDFMDPVTYYRGHDALGFKWDGNVDFYSSKRGDTAQSMIDDGVKDSFCFGPALVIDGVKQIIDNPTPGARQVLGVMPDGDIIIVSTSGVSNVDGPTYQETADLAHELGVRHAIPLDGGGSTQTLCNGFYMHPSNDVSGPRAIGGSFLLANVSTSGDSGTTWQRMNLINGFTHHTYSARFRVVEGSCQFSGAVLNPDATGAVKYVDLPWYARPSAFQRFAYLDAAEYQQYFDVGIDGAASAFSAATNIAPRYLSAIRYRID